MSKPRFATYKQVEKYIKEKTDNEFFITNTKSNTISIVITRNNKLLTTEIGGVYMAWLTEKSVDEAIKFINQ